MNREDLIVWLSVIFESVEDACDLISSVPHPQSRLLQKALNKLDPICSDLAEFLDTCPEVWDK